MENEIFDSPSPWAREIMFSVLLHPAYNNLPEPVETRKNELSLDLTNRIRSEGTGSEDEDPCSDGLEMKLMQKDTQREQRIDEARTWLATRGYTKNLNPIWYWRDNRGYPKLREFALKIYRRHPSNVNCERAFSIASNMTLVIVV